MSHEDEVREALRAVPISKLVAERMARDPAYAEHIRQVQAAVKPILDDLAKIGYRLERLSDLRHNVGSWEPAIPILLHWLPLTNNRSVKESIISCLSVPWTGTRATEYLIKEFKNTAESDPHYAWAIGNALSIVDVEGFEKDIIKICRNSKYGMSRQMLVMSLNRLDDPEGEETALDLLDDEDVRLHSIIALGKMKSRRALFHLEKLLKDKKALIRKEARRAITKIMR